MRPSIHLWFRRAGFAVAAVAASAVMVGTTASAQTGCAPEGFIAWAANRGPSVLFLTTPVDIQIERWSNEREKDVFVRTLLERGPDAFLTTLRQADSVGTIRTPLTVVDDIIFAWQEQQLDGGRRIILVTDRPMVLWRESMQIVGSEDLFTVLELRIAMNGEGEGKVAIGSNISVDRSRDMIQLKNYEGEPVRLIYVQRKRKG